MEIMPTMPVEMTQTGAPDCASAATARCAAPRTPVKAFLLLIALALAAAPTFAKKRQPAGQSRTVGQVISAVPDSQRLEKDLQQLTWPQLRFVIESVPKLKADVEAYGAFGWKYVKAGYATYPWQKTIDKLDDSQKRQLSNLIDQARTTR